RLRRQPTRGNVMGIDFDEKDRHVQHLDRRLRALQAGQSDVSASEDYDELLRIIHFPGYTTPVQLLFVNAVLESIERNVAEGMRRRCWSPPALPRRSSCWPARSVRSTRSRCTRRSPSPKPR